VQNCAMHFPTRTGTGVAWGRWRIGSHLRISIRKLSSIVLCVPGLVFLLPVAKGMQFLSRADLQSEPALQMQTQQASPSATDKEKPPQYIFTVESILVVSTPDPMAGLCKSLMPRGNVERPSSTLGKAVWRRQSQRASSRQGQKQLQDADQAEVR
jgi:hypothetical protein